MEERRSYVFKDPVTALETTGNRIEVGKVYTYYCMDQEIWKKFRLEKISLDHEKNRLWLDMFFLEEGRHESIYLRDKGVWTKFPFEKIYDESVYETEYLANKEEWDEEARKAREREEEADRISRELEEKNRITKERFGESLPPEKKKELVKYFNGIYPCREFGPHELALTYLAWLRGRTLIFYSKKLELISMGIDFDHEDHRITFEDPAREGEIDLAFTTKYYGLVNVWNIIKKREYTREELDDEGFPTLDANNMEKWGF